jgi:hypothetical protein
MIFRYAKLEVWISVEYTFFNKVIYHSAHVVSFDVHILQTQIQSLKASYLAEGMELFHLAFSFSIYRIKLFQILI